MEGPFEGGCGCGAVRFRLESRPMFINCCHCTWCQRETGSAFALNAMIEADRVTLLQGEVKAILTRTLSGAGQNITRCEACNVALWSNYGGTEDLVRFVRVGALDDAHLFPPGIHIFTTTRQPWVSLPADVPAVDEYYSRKMYWPPASLARSAALRAQKP